MATLEAVLGLLIPSDEIGPGAKEASVSRYILGRLAGTYEHHLDLYRAGLRALDEKARERGGRRFEELGVDAQLDLLRSAEQEAANSPRRRLLAMVVPHAMEGMFGDPRYGGNADGLGWKLIGYPGPRYSWSAHEQDLSEA